jgi:hypothetical protein
MSFLSLKKAIKDCMKFGHNSNKFGEHKSVLTLLAVVSSMPSTAKIASINFQYGSRMWNGRTDSRRHPVAEILGAV